MRRGEGREEWVCRAARATAVALFAALAFAATAWAQPRIRNVEAVGRFTTKAVAWGRDAGYSALVGDRIVWLFGDTFTPSGLRCATAAWSSPDRPLALREEVDAARSPHQLYRFASSERAFNRAHRKPPRCCAKRSGCAADGYCHCPPDTDCASRIAIWPGDVIAVDDHSAVGFYEEVVAGVAPYDFRHLGTGLARLAHGRTVAAREQDRDGKPLFVFSDAEPNFFRALAVEEASRRVVYAYAALRRGLCVVDVLIARVPLESIADRAAYRFWDGADWAEGLERARPILSGIPAGLGSVAWNAHLGSYVSAHADICSSGKMLLRSAPRPEGPWSEAATVDLTPLGATAESYAGILHPELGNGAEMWFSFYRPEKDGHGRVRLGKIRFE